MKHGAALLIALSAAGCSTQHPSLKQSPDRPAVIYAVPQSKAFAVARASVMSAAERCGADGVHIDLASGPLQGYSVLYSSVHYRFVYALHLDVIPAAGTGDSGQAVDGFRFGISTSYWPLIVRGPEGQACDKSLASTLQAALDATGTATLVTNLRYHQRAAGARSP